jgi:hypothetical protein
MENHSLIGLAADFSHAEKLITRARRTSLRWIDSGATELPHPNNSSHRITTALSVPHVVDGPEAWSSGRPYASCRRPARKEVVVGRW